MALLQTNTVLSTGNAGTPAAKSAAHGPHDGNEDSKFAAMLAGTSPKATAKTAVAHKAESKTDTSDHKAKPSGKTHTTRTAANADSRPAGKSGHKSAGKSDSKADARTNTGADDKNAALDAKADKASASAAKSQIQDADGDAENAGATTDAKTEAKPDNAVAQNAPDTVTAQLPAPPQPATPAPDASVLMAVAGPVKAAVADNAPVPNNADTGAKSVRAAAAPQAAATPASPPPAAANDDDQADDNAAAAQTPASAAQAGVKSAGHAAAKTQPADAVSTDAVKNSAPQPQDAAQAAPAPAAPTVQPTANNAAANLSGITATAGAPAANNAHAGASVATSVHVAAQDTAPNVNSLAIEIAAKSQGGAKQFQIRLDPPELGHVEVRLSIDASGKAQAHMTADQPQTLHLLQKDSESLTRALRDAGLDVSQGSLNFSLKGQDRQSGDDNSFARGRTPSLSLAATKTIDAAQSANAYRSSAGDARLDIHV